LPQLNCRLQIFREKLRRHAQEQARLLAWPMPQPRLAVLRPQQERALAEQVPWWAAIVQLPALRAQRERLARGPLRLAFLRPARNSARAMSESLQVWLDCQRRMIPARRRKTV